MNETIPLTAKKKWSRPKKLIITSIIVSMIVIGSLFLYFIFNNDATGPLIPTIVTQKKIGTGLTTWTVTGIGGGYVLKSDVYVQVKDADGTITISDAPLISDSRGFDYVLASKGFNYTQTSNWNQYSLGWDYISIGDKFSLDRNMYAQGSTITLYPKYDGVSVPYCILTI